MGQTFVQKLDTSTAQQNLNASEKVTKMELLLFLVVTLMLIKSTCKYSLFQSCFIFPNRKEHNITDYYSPYTISITHI